MIRWNAWPLHEELCPHCRWTCRILPGLNASMTSSRKTGSSKACTVKLGRLSSACRPHLLACTGPALSMTAMRQAPSPSCCLFELQFLFWHWLSLINTSPIPPYPFFVCLVSHSPVISNMLWASLQIWVMTHGHCGRGILRVLGPHAKSLLIRLQLKGLHQWGLDSVGKEHVEDESCMHWC